jgi:hypothetical protein
VPYQIGEEVYVARAILGLDENHPSPFFRTKITSINKKSVKVDLLDGSQSYDIAKSKIARNFGVMIIRVGDFNEANLLNPLAKSVLHYCRMLLPGDSVQLIELRTEGELCEIWKNNHGMCQQVVIVGHGCPDGFLFGNQNVTPGRLGEIFDGPNPEKKEFISLGCQTGYQRFGGVFSKARCVSHFIAPFHSIHGCVASLFAQTFLHERLLSSKTHQIAFKHARSDLMGAASFRLWKNGKLTAGPT